MDAPHPRHHGKGRPGEKRHCALFALGIPEAHPESIRIEDFEASLVPGRPFVPAMAEGVGEMEAVGFSIRDADVSMKNVRAARG